MSRAETEKLNAALESIDASIGRELKRLDDLRGDLHRATREAARTDLHQRFRDEQAERAKALREQAEAFKAKVIDLAQQASAVELMPRMEAAAQSAFRPFAEALIEAARAYAEAIRKARGAAEGIETTLGHLDIGLDRSESFQAIDRLLYRFPDRILPEQVRGASSGDLEAIEKLAQSADDEARQQVAGALEKQGLRRVRRWVPQRKQALERGFPQGNGG